MTRPDIYVLIDYEDSEDPVQGVFASWKDALKWAKRHQMESFDIEEWTWEDGTNRYRHTP